MQESKEGGHTLSSEGKCGGKLKCNHRQALPPDTQSDMYLFPDLNCQTTILDAFKTAFGLSVPSLPIDTTRLNRFQQLEQQHPTCQLRRQVANSDLQNMIMSGGHSAHAECSVSAQQSCGCTCSDSNRVGAHVATAIVWVHM